MNIGDKVQVKVTLSGRNSVDDTEFVILWGRVIYKHPQDRFITAEFTGRNGDTFRQSFTEDEVLNVCT